MSFRKFVRIHVYSHLRGLSARSEIRKYLKVTAEPKVNLGCGRNKLPGWLNTDLYPQVGVTRLDAAKSWPVPEGSITACLCEHMIEHVPKETGKIFITESYRALREGGALRIVTPDFAVFARFALDKESADLAEYLSGLAAFLDRGRLSVCDAINEVFYNHGHRYIYTVEELSSLLVEAGFEDLHVMRGGEYADSIFAGVDGHPKVVGQRVNEIEAFAIEARKPESAQS